jgi:hypothetical protein
MATQTEQLPGHPAQISNMTALARKESSGVLVESRPADNGTTGYSRVVFELDQHEPGPRPRTQHKMTDITGREVLGVRPQRSREMLSTKRKSESVTLELAKFLKTHPPPRGNFMSIPDGKERGRRPTFGSFRRRSTQSVSALPQKPLKLPDSAVAAKTISGHWHIAISIPIEHDYINQRATTSPAEAPSPQHENRSYSLTHHRPIIVRKPVPNARPASEDKGEGTADPSVESTQIARPRSTSVPLPLLCDTLQTETPKLKDENSANVDAAVQVEEVRAPVERLPPQKNPSSDVGVQVEMPASTLTRSATISNPPSVASSSRRTARTREERAAKPAEAMSINAIRSIYLREGHSSRKSTSSARLVLDLTESEPVIVALPSKTTSRNASTRSSISTSRAKADSVTSESPVADTKSPITTPSLQTLATKPSPSPAPTRKLPDPPAVELLHRRPPLSSSISKLNAASEAAAKGLGRRRNSSLSSYADSAHSDNTSVSTRPYVETRTYEDRQCRKDRVKAIRSRDMAAARATTMYHKVMASVSAPDKIPERRRRNYNEELGMPSIERALDLPPPSAKKRSTSLFATAPFALVRNNSAPVEDPVTPTVQKQVITISSVMLVASVEPIEAGSILHHTPHVSFSSQTPLTVSKPRLRRPATPALASSDEEEALHTSSRARLTTSPGITTRRSTPNIVTSTVTTGANPTLGSKHAADTFPSRKTASTSA